MRGNGTGGEGGGRGEIRLRAVAQPKTTQNNRKIDSETFAE